jgi:mono/diheme cytochrome c family protein
VKASRPIFVVFAMLMLSLLVALRSGARPQQGNAVPKTTAPKISESAEGEKRFRANCGRCHHPPDDLSPREARAVLRQMRVRAMLTAEDERLILKFLAP